MSTGLADLDGRPLVERASRLARARRSRSVPVSIALALCVAAVICVSISVGDFPIPLTEVVPAVFGFGSRDADFIVHTLRLPRALTAVLVGASFGCSGAVFQALTRNPFASPDIIGITTGASTAAVAIIVVFGSSSSLVSLGALGGALATAAVIYALAYRNGVSSHIDFVNARNNDNGQSPA